MTYLDFWGCLRYDEVKKKCMFPCDKELIGCLRRNVEAVGTSVLPCLIATNGRVSGNISRMKYIAIDRRFGRSTNPNIQNR
jgi:hypothetical protein